MRFIRLSVVFFCLLFMSVATQAQSVEDLIAQSDRYSTKDFNNEKALEKLLQADKASPNNWEILWRLSRTYVDIGEHLPAANSAQKKEVEAKYQAAFDYAERAYKIAPDKSITCLRRAIASGRIALSKGIFSVIGLVNDVKADVEKGIKLNNGGSEVLASCHYVLGRTHAKVCEKAYLVRLPLGLGWGNIETSFKEFSKAIELRPNFRMYRLDYAKALIEEDEYSTAKEQLYKIASLPVLDEDDNKLAAEASGILEKIKDK